MDFSITTVIVSLFICIVEGQLVDDNLNAVNNDIIKDGICGAIYNGTHTKLTIAVPTSDGTYSPNLLCRWEVLADEGDIWLVTSTYFSLEHSADCRWDYLMIRDGSDTADHLVDRYCGYEELSFLSSTNKLYFYFKSDGSLQERGFALNAVALHGNKLGDSYCSKIIETEAVVTSPNYPDHYPSNSLCLYWIKAPSENHRININLLDIAIEDTACVYDHLSIYDGPDTRAEKIVDICGNEIPAIDITSSGESMLLKFVSDSVGHDKGFRFEVKFKEFFIPDSHETLDCNEVIDGGIGGIISSPGFPVSYPSNVHCTVIINAPTDDHVKLTVTFLELEGSTNCTFDALEIFTVNLAGPKSLGKICGHTSQNIEFVSDYSTLRLEFTTDEYISWRGYTANYSIIPNEGCKPFCSEDHVCVNEQNVYRCMMGKRCEFNICETGDCVQYGGNVTCFCPANFTGALCNQRVYEKKDQEVVDNFQTGISDVPLSVAYERGKQVMIHCRVNLSEASYTWALDDRMILSDSGVIEHLNGSLEILHFDAKYVGMYKCLASTMEAFMQTMTNVTIIQGCDTDLDREPNDITVGIGQELCLTCNLDDVKNITWYFEDVEIEHGVHIEVSRNGSRICVKSTRPDDSGLYTCSTTRNDGCIVSSTTLVTVLRPHVDTNICGRPAVPEMMARFLGRISRGHTVEHGSSPWHVILRDRRERSTFCGGTLISRSWMVTAAHCTSNDHFSREFNKSFDASNIDLFVGTDFCNGTNGQRRGIRRYIPYPNFGQRAPYDNDIALIEFDKPVNYTNIVRPICLESLETVENIFMNRRFGRSIGRVIGCGRIHERITEIPPYLRDVFVPYVERRLCSNARIGNGNFTDSMFCAGYNRAYMGDACAGDSGGSLTMQRSERDPWYLVGIVSWGVGCDRPGHYGYYTHVAKFLNWIKLTTGIL